jgi:hypothetical protein
MSNLSAGAYTSGHVPPAALRAKTAPSVPDSKLARVCMLVLMAGASVMTRQLPSFILR